MASSVPGLGARPSTILMAGRNSIEAGVTPRMVALDRPLVPSLSRRMTTISSPTPRGPLAGAGTELSFSTRLTLGASMVLSSSEVAPLRRTTAASTAAARPSVFLIPVDSICTAEKTNTTRARPSTAAALVVLRTARLRTLYLMGTIRRTLRKALVTDSRPARMAGISEAVTASSAANPSAAT